VIQQLSGVHKLDDPYLKGISFQYGSDMEPHQKAAVDEVIPFLKDVPTPK
jgi:hypothetical protein